MKRSLPNPPPRSNNSRTQPDASSSGGWNSTTTRLPPYDSEKDPYNAFTRKDSYQKHMRKQHKLESLDKSAKLRRSQSIDMLQGGMKPMEGNSLSMSNTIGGQPGSRKESKQSIRNMSTISGGVTFSQFSAAREETVNPAAELTVLKSVLLREGYLRRLLEMSKESTHVLQPGLGDLLDIIRISSVEVVEGIAEWRKGLTKPVPFMWNGINYLVKMPSDLDFLNKLKPLTKWLGFGMDRNPFIIPLAMENRPGTAKNTTRGKDTSSMLTGHASKEGANADPGFTSIGGTVNHGSLTTTSHQQTSP